MDNRKEFIALAERYCTITLEEIEQAWKYNGGITMQKITGFGNKDTCNLCKLVSEDNYIFCSDCEWRKLTFAECNESLNRYTYINICTATTPKKLLKACRMRGRYMKQLIQKSHE